jgi:DNA-binding Lrp family transcriptional regulator
MDELDRNIINQMQDNFPVCERPFTILAEKLDMQEDQLMSRVQTLLDEGILSRFGPMYNIEELGGIYCLVAMRVPDHDLEKVIKIINAFPEVAHNYERTHEFNVWFVLAAESEVQLNALLEDIESKTSYPTYGMPKLNEYYVGLRFDA